MTLSKKGLQTWQKEIKLTQESLDAYKDELEYLKTTRADEVAEQLKEARSFGDLSENSEYDEAKNEQGKLYSRIAEVENILANYVVIEEHETDPNSVRLGSKVKVLDLEFEEEESYQVVAPRRPTHEWPYLRGSPSARPAGQRSG